MMTGRKGSLPCTSNDDQEELHYEYITPFYLDASDSWRILAEMSKKEV
jgi:hypothetical protein